MFRAMYGNLSWCNGNQQHFNYQTFPTFALICWKVASRKTNIYKTVNFFLLRSHPFVLLLIETVFKSLTAQKFQGDCETSFLMLEKLSARKHGMQKGNFIFISPAIDGSDAFLVKLFSFSSSSTTIRQSASLLRL